MSADPIRDALVDVAARLALSAPAVPAPEPVALMPWVPFSVHCPGCRHVFEMQVRALGMAGAVEVMANWIEEPIYAHPPVEAATTPSEAALVAEPKGEGVESRGAGVPQAVPTSSTTAIPPPRTTPAATPHLAESVKRRLAYEAKFPSEGPADADVEASFQCPDRWHTDSCHTCRATVPDTSATARREAYEECAKIVDECEVSSCGYCAAAIRAAATDRGGA